MSDFTNGIEGILIFVGLIVGVLVFVLIVGIYSSIADPIRKRREEKRREIEKEDAKQKEEMRRAQQQLEADKARNQRDIAQEKLQNVIINCPPCKGLGGRRRSIGVQYSLYSQDQAEWENYGGWNIPEPGPVKTEHGDDWLTCPYCGGTGIAIAVIRRDVQSQCDECHGSGQVLEKFAARLDIGIEKYKRMIPCRSCGGIGEIKRDVVTVRTLQIFRGKERFEIYLTDANRRFFYTNRPLEVPIREFIKEKLINPPR